MSGENTHAEKFAEKSAYFLIKYSCKNACIYPPYIEIFMNFCMGK